MSTLTEEISKRRTFAIISHPDAGKTTLTEKLLLFGGAIHIAGAVKSNKIKKTATSDWMEIEKQRGISVATSVMGFNYGDYKINILDTPGHQDFAEDTYRTLTAVDSVIIVVDVAKGVETQTRKLMEVCRMRNTPVIVFVNKLDREGRDPFDILDELESELKINVRQGKQIMADKIIENNQVSIMGKIASGFTFSHQVFGEGFYLVDVLVKRLSDSEDRIPLMISERLVDVTQDYEGEYIMVQGQFRSYNRHEEKKNRLVLSVFVREIAFVEEADDSIKTNQIFLDGYICKPPVYRKTPLGREIADLLLAVNRPYGKSDYIPCICWGRNARYASAFEVGGHVLIWGRIQSREYIKKLSETETEKRTAYEVSVSKLEYAD